MKQRYTIVIGVIISAVLLLLVFSRVDLARVQDALLHADYRWLFPAMLLLALSNVTRALRWRTLLNADVPLRHVFSILNVSYLFNGVLPLRLGELARLFLLARLPQPVPVMGALSTILVERLLDLLAVIAMLGGVLTALPVPGYVTTAGLVLGGGALAGLLVLVLLARWPAVILRLFDGLARWLPVLNRWRLRAHLARFLDGLAVLVSVRQTGQVLFWTVVSWTLSVTAGYVLLYAFFVQPTWLATLFFIVMASLAVSVPYAPGAVGPFEAGVVLALTLSGLDRPDGAAVAFAVVLHVMNTAVYALLGVAGLLHQGVSIGQVMRGSQHIDSATAPAGSSSGG